MTGKGEKKLSDKMGKSAWKGGKIPKKEEKSDWKEGKNLSEKRKKICLEKGKIS